MRIVEWGHMWKAYPEEGPARKFATKAEAEAWAKAVEGGADVTPGSRTIEAPKNDELDDFEDSLEEED